MGGADDPERRAAGRLVGARVLARRPRSGGLAGGGREQHLGIQPGARNQLPADVRGAGHGDQNWSPDGRELVFDVLDRTVWTVERAPVDGAGPPHRGYRLSHWTADRTYFIRTAPSPAGKQILRCWR